MIDGTDRAMATGTDRNRRTSIMAMHHAPPTAALGLVKRPARQTATSPNPMVRASPPGRSRREPVGKWVRVVRVAGLGPSSGGRAAPVVSVFAFTGRVRPRLVGDGRRRRRP